MEHHVPEHPLPEAIRNMKQDETVCKFCGVSYLIHREIKALEDRLKATRQELEKYKGSEQREQVLKAEVERLKQSQREIEDRLQEQNNEISSHKQEKEHQSNQIAILSSKSDGLEKELDDTVRDREEFRKRLNKLQERLEPLMTQLQQQKSTLQNIHTFVSHKDKIFNQECDRLRAAVVTVCQKELTDSKVAQEKCNRLEADKAKFVEETHSLQQQIQSLKESSEQLAANIQQVEKLRLECNSKEKEKQALMQSLDELTTRSRMTSIENEHYKERLKNKAQDLDNASAQSRTREQANEQTISILQRDMQRKESELQAALTKYRDLEASLLERQQEQERIQRQASASINQKEEIRKQLSKLQEELQGLKMERELMIASHQTRIDQLRESFKNKMFEAEKWPEKLEKALKNERQNHGAQMEALERSLKENFVMEMQIEKQKHQQLLDKYTSTNRDTENKIKSQISSINDKHKQELIDIEKMNSEMKCHSQETEDSLRGEIKSLKNIINALEEKLGNLDSRDDLLVVQLRGELKQRDLELTDSVEELDKLNSQMSTMKEENDFLQDTVRRECEERFELTEALSEAKEELLQLKKPAKGYSNPSSRMKTDSPQSVWSGGSEDNLKRTNSSGALNNMVPHPPPHPAPPSKEAANAANVAMGFEGDRARSQQGKVKGNSVNDSRKRIAQAMGRR